MRSVRRALRKQCGTAWRGGFMAADALIDTGVIRLASIEHSELAEI